jgi:hypothetical protein
MSPRYNNQWVLGRSRWRRRAPTAGSSARAPSPVSLPRQPHERPAGAHEHPGPALGRRPVRKRPRWIDRDT